MTDRDYETPGEIDRRRRGWTISNQPGNIEFEASRRINVPAVRLAILLLVACGELHPPAAASPREGEFAQQNASATRSAPPQPHDQIVLTKLAADLYHDGWIDFNKNGKQDVFEDPHADLQSRVDDLLSQMNVEEKTCQLVTLYGYQRVTKDDLPTTQWKNEVWKDGLANIDEHINGIPGWRGKPESPYVWPPSQHARALNEVQRWFVEETRLGIPVDFTNEGIRGICHHRATNFPAQVGVGATWNKQLVTQIGRVTGVEAAALGYTNIYSPILDLARDPRWGRVVECYGEDPYLVATLGVAQARALRAAGVASTAKHYAVYSVPKGGRDGNARTDPHVAPREMEQMYLMPFEAAIRDAGILGVMSSYNDYDGIPVSGSRSMLIDQLRGRLGFRGYVVSDSNAVRFLHDKHRVATSKKDAVRLFLESGGNVRTEFNPPKNFVLPLRELIEEGDISMEVVDSRVRDVLRVKFELGMFDNPYVADPLQSDELIHRPDHCDMTLQAARESIVLLKNEDRILPLRKDVASILVCGPNAAEVGHSISRYGPTGGEVISVLDGIRAAVSPDTVVQYAPGAEIVDSRWPESELFYEPPTGEDARMIAEAVRMADKADVIVAVLGESERTIGESTSRTDLNLTGYQRALVQSLHRTGKPIVVVLVNGRALTINWIDRHIPAIVEAWFAGEACGRAVADVLFGDYNPGGKLPVTFPRTVGQLPFNFPYKPASQAGQGKGHNPNGIGDSRITGELYPFGFGLSYTTFAYDDLQIMPTEIRPGQTVTISCRITNSGDRAGDEVVQLYLRDDVSSVTTYDSMLRGFERIHLAPGESQTVSFRLAKRDMQLLNQEMERVVEPGQFTVMVGSSSKDLRLRGTYQVILTRKQQTDEIEASSPAAGTKGSGKTMAFGEGGQIKMLYDRRQRPQSVFLNNQVHIVFNAGGKAGSPAKSPTQPMAITYDPLTREFSEVVTLGPGSKDHHDGPVIWADEDGFLHVLFGCHKTPGTHLISRQPGSIGRSLADWKTSSEIAPAISYPTVFHVFDNRQVVYYRTGGHASSWTYRLTHDHGKTWTGPANDVTDMDIGGRVEWSSYQTKLPSSDGRILHVVFMSYDDVKSNDPKRLYNPRYDQPVRNDWKYNLYYVRIDLQTHDVTNFDGETMATPIDIEQADAKCRIWDTKWRGAGVPPTIILDEDGAPALLHVLSGNTLEDHQYYYVRRANGKWKQTPIADSNHQWNSCHLSRESSGALHAYLIRGDGYLKPGGYMDKHGGGRIEQWTSFDKGNAWTKTRDLTPDSSKYPGWKFNNIQPVTRPDGSFVDGMLLFYGWKDGDTPKAQAFLLHEDPASE